MKRRKKQTAVKGRFSAMMISAAVHVAVLIAAGAFVAVTWAFSKELVPAFQENTRRLHEWITPLNADKKKYGIETLASPGVELEFEPLVPIPNTQSGWPAGLSYAIQQGADSVYWMGTDDRMSWIHRELYRDAKRGRPIDPPSGQPPEYEGYDFSVFPGGEARWNQLVEQARKMHEEENARRIAAGQPIRVLPGMGGPSVLVPTYFPGTSRPPFKRDGVAYWYEAQDIIDYVQAMLRKHRTDDRRSAQTGLRGGQTFSLNVVHFVPINVEPRELERLALAAQRLNGRYIQIQGMEAIRSAASAGR